MTWKLSGFGDEIDADPVIQLSVLQALGAKHIEVRSAWGTNIIELSDEQLDALAALIAERDMGVSAIASPIGKVDAFGDPDTELARFRQLERSAAIDLATVWLRGTSPLVEDFVAGARAALGA